VAEKKKQTERSTRIKLWELCKLLKHFHR